MKLDYFNLVAENEELKKEIARLKANQFDEYEVVDYQIKRSNIPRINWKAIFGESLTKVVAEYYAKGNTAPETYTKIEQRLKDMAITNTEILRKLKIGVCARFGEIRSETNKIKRVEKEHAGKEKKEL